MNDTQPGSGGGAISEVVEAGNLPFRDRQSIRRDRIRRKTLERVNLGSWRLPPGVASYSDARRHVGGSIATRDFRAGLEELLAEGSLLECWGTDETGRSWRHRLINPGRRAEAGRIIQVRGRRDLVEREFADLLDGDLDRAFAADVKLAEMHPQARPRLPLRAEPGS